MLLCHYIDKAKILPVQIVLIFISLNVCMAQITVSHLTQYVEYVRKLGPMRTYSCFSE